MNISANCTAIAAFFLFQTQPEGEYEVILQEKCPFSHHYTFIVDLIRKFDARK
jgi:hypothetical protein